MKAILIDSDILIEVALARDRPILARWEALSEDDAVILCSPVTVAELWHGARPSEHSVLSALFAAMTCIPIDAGIGRLAGDYLRQFRKSHHVELGDALIAATVVIHQTALWTRIRCHYPIKDIVFY